MANNINTKTHLRKTRIVCISDTHGASPKDGAFKLPKGDVLIHAGDLTNQGTYSELRKTVDWIAEADFEVKIVVAGNHDITLDAPFYASHGPQFHNQRPQSPTACLSLLTSNPSITFLNHTSTTIRLTSPTGPQTTFRVFASPLSPTIGTWAFSYPPCPSARTALSPLSSSFDPPSQTTTFPLSPTTASGGSWYESGKDPWSQIPLDTDVLVTHTPPRAHLDLSPKHGRIGCTVLQRRLWEVRPALHVCGHVHEGWGAEVVRWGLEPSRVGREEDTVVWDDFPRGGKGRESRVDLTGRRRREMLGRGLENGFSSVKEVEAVRDRSQDGETGEGARMIRTRLRRKSRLAEEHALLVAENREGQGMGRVENHVSFSTDGNRKGETRLGSMHHGYTQAWNGREGRRETCIVNAAIMAKSHGMGAKRYNQPIVVEVDLPVWGQKEDERDAAMGRMQGVEVGAEAKARGDEVP
ncbi:hypothetical protein B9Z65_1092 [Elsinoe australis]|uniref:Calcineurin-like phosphoesterase domain-containing protein n=1 Tax=Elsinoe australis TaxID=40998 RepID=A0A2P8AIC9_9PEZI|nr:hypothetical protein B9Z65_1092 [Elsinoe australis]